MNKNWYYTQHGRYYMYVYIYREKGRFNNEDKVVYQTHIGRFCSCSEHHFDKLFSLRRANMHGENEICSDTAKSYNQFQFHLPRERRSIRIKYIYIASLKRLSQTTTQAHADFLRNTAHWCSCKKSEKISNLFSM